VIVLADAPELAAEQLRAIIYYLTTLAYVDGEYHDHERVFVATRIHKLVANHVHYQRAHEAAVTRARLIEEQTRIFQAVAEDIDREVQALFDEAVLTKEGREAHVRDKLELRCFEVLRSFDADARVHLLEICDELILADGVEHPAEKRFRQDIEKLLALSAIDDSYAAEALPPLSLRVMPATVRRARTPNDDFLSALERPYPTEAGPLRKEAALDKKLIQRAIDLLGVQRARGEGKLDGVVALDELAGREPFLDRFVYAVPPRPGARIDMTVLGDLHGCYSCLKAAVLQCDFLGKLAAWRAHPEREPEPKLVFLGDYVDRGMYSYEGVLRAALSLFVHAPEQVYLLRGNHEHYRVLRGKVAGVVSPAEAIEMHGKLLPQATMVAYKDLFEQLPSVLLFHRIVMVHAGIPRDALLDERYDGLGSLNDPLMRFEMAWSDPSSADHVPRELQAKTSRFAFGRRQLHRFLARMGANVLIRGHEVVDTGFRTIYDDGRALLLNVFSAGGALNDDLPMTSPYRRLSPAALTLALAEGKMSATPWKIDYEPYVVPGGNHFYAPLPYPGVD
jgi:hypothetical protein